MQGLIDLVMISLELMGLAGLRQGMAAGMLAAGIRKGNPLGSSYMALRFMPFVIAMQMMAGNLDDEEEWEKMITYYIRHIPFAGLTANLISELILALSFGDEEVAIEGLKDAAKTIVPLPQGMATPLVDKAGKLILPDKKKKKKSKYR